jgi:hypothetical protein
MGNKKEGISQNKSHARHPYLHQRLDLARTFDIGPDLIFLGHHLDLDSLVVVDY